MWRTLLTLCIPPYLSEWGIFLNLISDIWQKWGCDI